MLGTTPDTRSTSPQVTAAIFSILFVILLQKPKSPSCVTDQVHM